MKKWPWKTIGLIIVIFTGIVFASVNLDRVIMTREEREHHHKEREEMDQRFTISYGFTQGCLCIGILTDNETGQEYLYVNKGSITPLINTNKVED